MTPEEADAQRLRLEYRLAKLEVLDQAKGDFLSFVKYVWPEAIIGSHHEKMANAFNRVVDGSLKRLIINMPPRHTKSEFASYLLPAYVMGHRPRTKIIQATHTLRTAESPVIPGDRLLVRLKNGLPIDVAAPTCNGFVF